MSSSPIRRSWPAARAHHSTGQAHSPSPCTTTAPVVGPSASRTVPAARGPSGPGLAPGMTSTSTRSTSVGQLVPANARAASGVQSPASMPIPLARSVAATSTAPSSCQLTLAQSGPPSSGAGHPDTRRSVSRAVSAMPARVDTLTRSPGFRARIAVTAATTCSASSDSRPLASRGCTCTMKAPAATASAAARASSSGVCGTVRCSARVRSPLRQALITGSGSDRAARGSGRAGHATTVAGPGVQRERRGRGRRARPVRSAAGHRPVATGARRRPARRG